MQRVSAMTKNGRKTRIIPINMGMIRLRSRTDSGRTEKGLARRHPAVYIPVCFRAFGTTVSEVSRIPKERMDEGDFDDS